MRTVAVLLDDDMRVFDYAVVAEIWGIDRTDTGVPAFEMRRCSQRRRSVTTDAGTEVRASHGLTGLADADLVVVPGTRRPARPVSPAILRALRRVSAARVPVAALCGGAFVLAQAGVLHGRRATTHWLLVDMLRRQFPDVDVDGEALFVEDSGVWTSAGTAAGMDLCLHLVRTEHGAAVASNLARRLVMPPHRPGGDPQYVDAPVSGEREDRDPLAATLGWAREHLGDRLTVGGMAAYAHLSERAFARRFVEATGTTPLRWLNHQRVLLAQQLLEATSLSVQAIAERTGFGSAPVLRRHFGRVTGTAPTTYRRDFLARGSKAAPSRPEQAS